MPVARRLVRGLQRLLPRARPGLRLLCYHLVGAGTDSPVDVPRDDFARQMDRVAELSTPVGLSAGVEAVESATADDRALTAVTFDDAYRNFREVAWPLLQERGIPATLFVPTGFVDGTAPAPLAGASSLPPLTWDELQEMADTGSLAVGAHTATHADLRRLDARGLEAELVAPRRQLEDRLGAPVEAFCYPRAAWDPRVEAAVRDAYGLAVVGGGRRVRPGRVDRYRLPRTSVRRRPALPVREWLRHDVWLEEAIADWYRRRR